MTNFHVSWKSAGKVNFLKGKVIKRRAWKTLNVISTLAIVVNTGMVGALLKPTATSAAGAAGNLDQCRNGSAASPANCIASGGATGWVNGNAGSSQAHYAEGMSIPYREVLTGLPTDGTVVELTLEYDIKHSSKHAIDYLTAYNRLSPHDQFGHPVESIDPTSGVAGVSGVASDTHAIPAPSASGSPVAGQPTTSFNALPASERLMSIWNGDITNIAYVSQGNLGSAAASTSVKVSFIPSASTAVLAWGGHIASRNDWGFSGGSPRSAGGISGSPYHMRQLSWNIGNLGNQDRSLSADAVQPLSVVNPPLVQACGLDVGLVIDSSDSISNSDLATMKTAFNGFVGTFLPGTPTQFSVTEFDTTASVKQSFTDNVALLTTAINGAVKGGYTNWDDGLVKAWSTFDPRVKPNLILFASDGNPNRIGDGTTASEATAVAAAITRANAIKTAGTRIVTLGIGSSLDIPNLQAISGPSVATSAAQISVNSDVITADFATLATTLSALADELCGGKILVQKQFDTNGDGQADLDGSQADPLLAGWNFDVNGSPTNPAAQDTTSTGALEFTVENGTYSVVETNFNKAGTGLVSGICKLNDQKVGTFNADTGTISNLTMGTDQTISCTFINQPKLCNLDITKSVNKQSALPGDTLTYTLHYQNIGNGDCTGGGVRVDDTVPAGVTYDGTHTQTAGTDYGYAPSKFGITNPNPAAGASLISWNANVLTPGEEGEVTWQATVNETPACTEKNITNIGKIYADQNTNGITSNEVSTHVSTPCEGSIKVNKKVDANGDGTFEGGNTEANALGFDWGLDAGAINRDMGTTATGLTVGSHSVTESVASNYHFVGWYPTGNTGFSCANPKGTTLPISVSVAASTTTEITLCNAHDLGRLLVKKNVLNPDGSEVADTHEFTVTLDGVNPKIIAEGISAQYPGLATGTYTVAENPDGDYTLDGYDIDTDPGTPGAQITITKGATTILTVTNKQKKATITISKDVRDFQGNDVSEAGNFSVTSNAGDFTIAEFDPEVLSVNPGTYTFTEGANANYTIHSTNPKEITVGSNGSREYTFENWQKPSYITGQKFEDHNGNGTKKDAGDQGLANWEICIGAQVCTLTDVNGNYSFGPLASGTYTVTETQQTGWTQTTPNGSHVVNLGFNQTAIDKDFGNFKLGKISGYKYDTLQNALADWQICLNGDQECTTTNVNGYYEFTGLSAGDYTVAETLQPFWWAVTPLLSGYPVTINSGDVLEKNFTNFHGVNISGSKFNDIDGNGSWNNEEPGLGGWTIELYKNNEGFELVDTMVTDGTGTYNFTNLGPGTYRVREVQQGGWTQTTANPSDITVVSGQNLSNIDFGNYQYGRISGYKFNDLDGDGYWDEGEPTLDGWSICLNGTENCVVTGSDEWADGYYEFTGLTAGTYEVYEQGKAGWTQTRPDDEYEIVVTSGTNSDHNDFGNFQYGRVSGYKYNYADDEPLDGWQICLLKNQPELNSISRVSIQEPNCKITGAGEWEDGYYEFTGLTAGDYTVSETQQYGWTQTAPEGNVFNISVQSGTDSKNNDFWNRKNVFGVSVEKSADLEVVQAGSNITYTLNWTLTGNTSAEVKLFDVLPANTTFVSADNGGFLDGNTVRWNLGTYSPVTNFSVHLTVKVNSPLDKGTVISNTANVCGLGAISEGEPFLSDSEDLRRQKCDDDTTTTTVDSKPILGIEKTANPTTVGGNQDVTYTITWSVAGNSKATNVVVNDPIPSNTSYVSMGCGTTTGTCTTSTTGTPVTSTTWNLGTRNPGEGGTLTLVVKTAISVPNGSVIPNKADIRSAEVDPVFAQADVKAATAPQLQITKTTNATIVNPGDPVSYTVKVKNIGTDTAINAVMTDTLPAGFSFVSTNPAAASIVGQTGTWNLGTMTVGQEVTITYTVNVAPGTSAGTYDNIAKAKADNAPEVSTKVPVQTRVPQVLGETTNPVLQLRKSVSKATVAPGDTVTYTVEIKNTGTGSAINVILTDLLPVGFTFDGSTNTTKEWSLGDLAVGQTKTLSYKVKVGSSVPNGSYENLAIASADNHGKVTTSVPVNVKRGRVLAEVIDTGAGPVDLVVAGAGLGLIILGYVLTRRKRGEELA